MKRAIYVFVACTVVFVLLASTHAFAQDKTDKTPVKVKNSVVVTGVVIVHVQKEKKTLDLQCNEGAGSCKALQSGPYLMAELPPNYGLYDCKNVEMYQGSQDNPEEAVLVGEYCVVEK